MPASFRLCPRCGEEYVLALSECPDCRVELLPPGERPAEPVRAEFPPVSELVCVRVGPLPWTRALSETLEAAGIEHRVELDTRTVGEGGIDARRFGGEDLFGTWVLPEQLEAAREIDQAFFGHLEAGAPLAAGEEERCPACEEPLPPEGQECPGCGLQLG